MTEPADAFCGLYVQGDLVLHTVITVTYWLTGFRLFSDCERGDRDAARLAAPACRHYNRHDRGSRWMLPS
jgi:hypothetical protein